MVIFHVSKSVLESKKEIPTIVFENIIDTSQLMDEVHIMKINL